MAGTGRRKKGFEEIFVTAGGIFTSPLLREMKKGYDNKTLDLVGKRLLDTEPLPAGNIEKIVANPELFCRVRERIASERTASIVDLRQTSPFRRYAIAYSGITLTVAAAAVIAFYRPEIAIETPSQVVNSQVPDAVPDTARTKVPPQPITGKLSAVRAEKKEFRVEKSILPRTKPASHLRRDRELDTRFIPVSYTGDPDETSAGGQVIRVEMKRSSLFAIGVDLPLENDDSVVKADLLIGRDGVTRAVRMVD